MSASYTPVAKGLHGLMAVMIIGVLGLGLWMEDLPLSPQKLQAYAWHKWLGVTVFALVWLRLAWRLGHPPPPWPVTLSPAHVRLIRAGHVGLYSLMVLIPLTGWLMSSAKGFQTVWWGVWPIPDLIGRDPVWGARLRNLHEGLNQVLMVALAGHVAAALWHHLVLKDGTLRRMGWRAS